MANQISISGRKVAIAWNIEVSRRFRFRLGAIGGHPSRKELTTAATAESAFTKILWALLPAGEFAKYETPEDLFVALDIDGEEGASSIAAVITSIYDEMSATVEKKTSGRKKPLPESNSE